MNCQNVRTNPGQRRHRREDNDREPHDLLRADPVREVARRDLRDRRGEGEHGRELPDLHRRDRQVLPLAEDQDAVGEFAPGSEGESFGEAVRSRTMRRDLHGVDLSVRFTPDTTICTRTSPS
jgi:hypothetical protein